MQLKTALQTYGIVCFVAHEDIEPSQGWLREMENALHSMDAFVALLTKDFHQSVWTNQEVGFALCREVPVAPVNMAINPRGFMRDLQVWNFSEDFAGDFAGDFESLAKALLTHFLDTRHHRIIHSILDGLAQCPSFEVSKRFKGVLEPINTLCDAQVARFIAVYNANRQLRQSFFFNLLPDLNRWRPKHFVEDLESKKIRPNPSLRHRLRRFMRWFC